MAIGTMRHASFRALCIATLFLACARVGNDERAYFARHGQSYLVEMKGRRRLMAHDPVSAIRGRTYEDTLTIELPRLEGTIDGSEIPVTPGKLRYLGQVVIARPKMNVDLYYDDPGDAGRRPLPWNGEYTLVEKTTASQ